MNVLSIEYPTPLETSCCAADDNFDVFVTLEDGFTYTIVVATPQNLEHLMKKENMSFFGPYPPMIIVSQLTYEVVEQAIKRYSEGNAYWLKEYFLSGSLDIEYLDEKINQLKE